MEAIGQKSKLCMIEQSLEGLNAAICKLEFLNDDIQGVSKPNPVNKKLPEVSPVRPLMIMFNELPEELISLTDRITKIIEQIRQAIY